MGNSNFTEPSTPQPSEAPARKEHENQAILNKKDHEKKEDEKKQNFHAEWLAAEMKEWQNLLHVLHVRKEKWAEAQQKSEQAEQRIAARNTDEGYDTQVKAQPDRAATLNEKIRAEVSSIDSLIENIELQHAQARKMIIEDLTAWKVDKWEPLLKAEAKAAASAMAAPGVSAVMDALRANPVVRGREKTPPVSSAEETAPGMPTATDALVEEPFLRSQVAAPQVLSDKERERRIAAINKAIASREAKQKWEEMKNNIEEALAVRAAPHELMTLIPQAQAKFEKTYAQKRAEGLTADQATSETLSEVIQSIYQLNNEIVTVANARNYYLYIDRLCGNSLLNPQQGLSAIKLGADYAKSKEIRDITDNYMMQIMRLANSNPAHSNLAELNYLKDFMVNELNQARAKINDLSTNPSKNSSSQLGIFSNRVRSLQKAASVGVPEPTDTPAATKSTAPTLTMIKKKD